MGPSWRLVAIPGSLTHIPDLQVVCPESQWLGEASTDWNQDLPSLPHFPLSDPEQY